MKLRIFYISGDILILKDVKSYYINKETLSLIIDFYNGDTRYQSLSGVRIVECQVRI